MAQDLVKTGADDRWQVEKFQDARALHQAPGCGPGRRGQVLPAGRGVNSNTSY